jgi:signal transduction histidine kinase
VQQQAHSMNQISHPARVRGGKNGRSRPFWGRLVSFFERYSIILAGIVIYLYYLLTSVDLIKRGGEHLGFFDYVLQFDSLILLWIIAAVVIQLQRHRRQQREEQEHRRKIEMEFEKQRIHAQLLDEMTKLLQDNVNNPLAMISITSHTIRKKFANDEEIINWLDRIDTSLQRIHSAISEIKSAQAKKIVDEGAKLASGL